MDIKEEIDHPVVAVVIIIIIFGDILQDICLLHVVIISSFSLASVYLLLAMPLFLIPGLQLFLSNGYRHQIIQAVRVG